MSGDISLQCPDQDESFSIDQTSEGAYTIHLPKPATVSGEKNGLQMPVTVRKESDWTELDMYRKQRQNCSTGTQQ